MNLGNLVGDITRPIEKEAGSLASGVLKLFGGQPAIETTALSAAHDAVVSASAALETATAQADQEADAILEKLADGVINGGVGSIPGLNMIAAEIDPMIDGEANSVIETLTGKVVTKLQALLTPKPAPAAAPAEAA